MKVTLRVWRQDRPGEAGGFKDYPVEVVPEMSFLEVLDVINDELTAKGEMPIAFEHDCREGICGSCGAMVNGRAHGPGDRATLCQVHMRQFKDGDLLVVEPWRAEAFPVIRDLVVDRSALDRIIQSGGYISVRTGSAPDANSLPIGKPTADLAFDYAACIGCGACVAACPNASATLFTAAKASQLNLLPQGQVEKTTRAIAMVDQMDAEKFGSCTNHGECASVCPKGIPLKAIAQFNRDLFWARLVGTPSKDDAASG
jgi:succinate dehydrogenase / fumarate reductase iron-sulfur subunit